MKKIPLTLITGLSALAMSASAAPVELLVNGDMQLDEYGTGGNHLAYQDLDQGWGVKSQNGIDFHEEPSNASNQVIMWDGPDANLLQDGLSQIVSVGTAAGSSLTFSFDWFAATGSTTPNLSYQVVGWKDFTSTPAAGDQMFKNINGTTKTVNQAGGSTAVSLVTGPISGSNSDFTVFNGTAGAKVSSGNITLDLSGFGAGYNDVSDYTVIGVRFHIDGGGGKTSTDPDPEIFDLTGIGSYLDNVSLIAPTTVPEPSAYALLSGLLALSFVMVRRRK